MILRHCRNAGEARSVDDTFEAIDEHSGKTLGICTVIYLENELLYPNRPLRVMIDLKGDSLPDALLGAVSARAKEIARSSDKPARVFTVVEPDDKALLDAVVALGFKDNDGVVLLSKDLDEGTIEEPRFPAGCIPVEDKLTDQNEQLFFMERYDQIHAEAHDNDWLQEFIGHDYFRRYLLCTHLGMAGELAAWVEGDHGVIGWFNVAPKWRRHGIADGLIRRACIDFKEEGLHKVECATQARIPGVLRLLDQHGFKQQRVLMRYPGIDIGPTGGSVHENKK